MFIIGILSGPLSNVICDSSLFSSTVFIHNSIPYRISLTRLSVPDSRSHGLFTPPPQVSLIALFSYWSLFYGSSDLISSQVPLSWLLSWFPLPMSLTTLPPSVVFLRSWHNFGDTAFPEFHCTTSMTHLLNPHAWSPIGHIVLIPFTGYSYWSTLLGTLYWSPLLPSPSWCHF